MRPGLIILLIIFSALLLPISDANAAYRIYLKNGSVIKGVSHYEKIQGEIRFYFGGGMMGIPEKDILKIESTDEPASNMTVSKELPMEKPMPAEIEPPAEEKAAEAEKAIDEREISQKEEDLKKAKEDLQITMVRIQNLYLEVGRLENRERELLIAIENATTKEQKDILIAQLAAVRAELAAKRTMLQQNMFRKRKFEDEIGRLEAELSKLKGQ